ncbi:MAG: asparagine synthase (glutamine-hydrolyzing) [Candidatus Omnitrophica bacterium CG11_big_fil_rev_8_21_14_0_20_41_12]|nr:MAG: asparagine synthase (glutamine-hydrolyzing) [Candidatus Omnitrophica bacterium CG11_big_fil_rev_8_21_14_0_20_41_12]
MCGIAGKINWNSPVGQEAVVEMCEKMRHRGPDDHGIVSLGNITLGHRRLSIIDLSESARQPMASSDRRYFIVYNGEVYNFKELKKELEELGVGFRTLSDTEVVLYSYIHWGIKCLDKFNGMFAFAVWDNHRKELFMARDRFGKKPLYYYQDGDRLTFASELSALICDGDIPHETSYEALNSYLALGYILSPLTMYKDIFKLEAATYMIVSDSGRTVKKDRYWNYADQFRIKTDLSEDDIAENVLGLLENAIKRRMVSDVPIGAFLSGGIDSSSVSSIMKGYHEGQLHTFSMGFDQPSYSEIKDAGGAANWIGTIHHEKICKAGESLDQINNAIDAYDELFSDTSLIPTFELSKLTSSYVKVALSGDGADEIFAGYPTYIADRCYGYTKIFPVFLKKLLLRMPELLPGSKNKKMSFGYKQKQFFYGSLHPAEQAHYLWRIIFNPEERVQMLGENHRGLVYDTDPYLTFKKYYGQTQDLHWLDKYLYVDAMTWLTDDILVKVDRASMKNSLEVRSPYLDVDLASFAASIPADLKLRGFNTKYILKQALRTTLPDFILKKKKSGFNAPVGSWIGYDGIDEFKAFNQFVFNKFVH